MITYKMEKKSETTLAEVRLPRAGPLSLQNPSL